MAKRISITGVLHGVGFRPFVYGLAVRLGLHGWVCNTPEGVEILVDGQGADIERFIQSLSLEKPALAEIDSVRVEDVSAGPFSSFEIRESQSVEGAYQPISADLAICPECERELFNPDDKRYLYPFISCAHCGPRFTIIRDIPFDRRNTTMASFAMCDECLEEYNNPLNRRFHAHAIACPECGPFVELRETHAQSIQPDSLISSIECRIFAIFKVRRLLRQGRIVAIKGLGGFHLACDASNTAAVQELRRRKGQSRKPLAMMAASLKVVEAVCNLSDEERALLTGREKPILLLERKNRAEPQPFTVSEAVAPDLDRLGIMLPYTPLHHLLLNQTDPVLACEPAPPLLVMTGGNPDEEAIATANEEALQRLSPLADALLLHNREIHIRCDDSVVRLDRRAALHVRRSRGYAPYSIRLPFEIQPVLAVGSQRRNSFCVARDHSAFLSHCIGTLENREAYESFEQGIRHFLHVFCLEPRIIAHDLDPGDLAAQYAKQQNIRQIAVQHHHAHIAACMADNGLDDRYLIGLAFDGSNRGSDGAIWGGEILLASYADFERLAHLEYLPLPGGDPAILAPWRIAVAYTQALEIDIDGLPFLAEIDRDRVHALRGQVEARLDVPLTSSMGRLFDAVAALSGVRSEATYEGEAALELEALSRPLVPSAQAYPYRIDEGMLIRLKELLQAVVQDVRARKPAGLIGARFHRTIAEIALEVCRHVRSRRGIGEVALSGDLWHNQILSALVCEGLEKDGFTVFFHKQTPPNDSGLALGQAVVAHAALRHREAISG